MIYLVDIQNEDYDEPLMQNLEMAYLASDLLSNGYDVCIIDGKGIHRDKSLDEIYEELYISKPQYITFYTKEFTCNKIIEMICKLKLVLDFNAILVGPGVVFNSMDLMQKHKEIDFIVYGDPILNLVKVLSGDYTTQGITYRKRNQLITNKIRDNIINLDIYPVPIRENKGINYLTKINTSKEEKYIVPMRSSRGCTYNCSFCTFPTKNKIYNSGWCKRSNKDLLKEIQVIHGRYKDIEIRFLDENFSEDIDRVFEIATSIAQLGDIKFSFTARVSTITKIETEKLMKLYNLGVQAIEVGVENFNDNVLQRYRKGHTGKEAIEALRKIRDSGIIPAIDFIMFDPWTTTRELDYNLNVIEHENLDVETNPILYNRLYPFVGTAYYNTINMNSYFENEEIDKIYQKLKQFKTEISKKRFLLSKDKQMLSSLVLLKAPYKFLRELLGNSNIALDDSRTYKTIKYLI